LADDLQGGTDDRIVSGGPCALLAGLDRVGGGGCAALGLHGRGGKHRWSPFAIVFCYGPGRPTAGPGATCAPFLNPSDPAWKRAWEPAWKCSWNRTDRAA